MALAHRAAQLAAGAVCTRSEELANARMCGRQRVGRRIGQLVDHAHRVGLATADAAAAQDQVERVLQTRRAAPRGQQPRQPLRAAVAGQQPQADLGLAEARRALGNAVVAGQRELHATAECDALDGRDARLVHALDLAERQVRVVRQRARFVDRANVFQQLADVGTRHEAGRALAGEHHRHHIVAPRQVFDHDRQLVQCALVQRIHRRVGHRDGGDARFHARRSGVVVLHREVAVALEHLLVIGQLLLALPLADHGAQLGQAFRVLQRRLVADLAVFDECAHHAPHVLAAARLGELADLDEVAGHGHGALLAAHQFGQAALVVLRQLAAGRGPDEGERREALLAVRRADHDDVADGAVRVERLVAQDRAFDFLGAHAVAADVDDVVAAAVQREAAVGMAHREVALRVGPGATPARPVGVQPTRAVTAPGRLNAHTIGHRFDAEVRRVAPHRACEVGVRCGDDDLALLAHFGGPPDNASCGLAARPRDCGDAVDACILQPHITGDPRQRVGVRVGMQREVGIAVEVRPDHAAVLGGPVAVDVVRRHQVHAELLHRRAGGLGAERGHAQAAQVVLLHVARVLRVGHDGLQEGHAGLEDAHPVALDHRGVAAGMREGRRAFAEHAGAARDHRRAEHVALAGDPAWVGHHIDHITRPRIEGHLHRVRHAGHIAAVHMHHALGLAGGAAGVDEEQRELGVERLRLRAGPDGAHEVGIGQGQQRGFVGHGKASGARGGQQCFGCSGGEVVRPAVALGPPHQVGLRGVAHHHHGIHARWRGHQRLGHAGAHARGLGRVQPAGAAQFSQRAAHAAHRVAALHGHLAGQRVVDDGQHLLGVGLGQAHRGQPLCDGLAHGRHRHIVVQRRVGVGGLERHDLRVAVAAVGRDDDARTGVVNAVGKRLVAEATEHRRVDDAEPLGAFGPVHLSRNVGQVQGDAVTGLQAQRLQCQRAFSGLQQQRFTRDGVRIDRCATAVVLRHVPAVALEQERRLGTEARQHMAVDLVEAGVRQPALEPLPVRRLVVVEGASPRFERRAEVGTDRCAGARAPARPAAGAVIEVQPRTGRARAGDEPVDLPLRDGTVKGTRVGQCGGALALPVGTAAHRVDLRRRQRPAVLGFRRVGGGDVVHPWGPCSLGVVFMSGAASAPCSRGRARH